MTVPSSRSLTCRSIASVVVVLAIWELVGDLKIFSPLFLPAFTVVLKQLAAEISDGSLVTDLSLSLGRAALGLAIALGVGVTLGIGMARSRPLHWFFDPLIALGFPAPKIAFMPLFVLWLGIDSLSKVMLVAFACTFPIVIGSYNAARAINRVIIWSALSLGTKPIALLFRIILPACRARIFATFRVALPVALINVFTAEMVTGGGGMGATLMYSQRYFESPTVFAYILVMLAVGLVLDKCLSMLSQRYAT
jgi:ABC-type nitrate/sulfonate/bicarbonate transport system permease component